MTVKKVLFALPKYFNSPESTYYLNRPGILTSICLAASMTSLQTHSRQGENPRVDSVLLWTSE